jgi:hypothetical protein
MDRPSQVWKTMPVEKRVEAAEAFWRDRESPDSGVQQMEAVAALAKRLKFRVQSVQALPVERRARHLAQMADVGDTIAGRALIAYHFSRQRGLMAAFLDALGIAHEDGLITADEVPPPDRSQLAAAVDAVRASFPAEDVELYLRTLGALDSATWANLDGALAAGTS